MNREDIKKAIAVKTGESQKTAKVYMEAMLDSITEGLKAEGTLVEGNKVQITNFGTFTVKMRKGKKWSLKDRTTGILKEGVSEDKLVVTFKAGKGLEA